MHSQKIRDYNNFRPTKFVFSLFSVVIDLSIPWKTIPSTDCPNKQRKETQIRLSVVIFACVRRPQTCISCSLMLALPSHTSSSTYSLLVPKLPLSTFSLKRILKLNTRIRTLKAEMSISKFSPTFAPAFA